MTETVDVISGLHTCKPENEPHAGEIKCFSIEKKVSQAGKPWLKVRNSTPDKGGLDYRIVNVKETGFTDAHGNISYNVELERVNDPVIYNTPSGPVHKSAIPPPPAQQNAHSDPVEACKGHLERAGQAMKLCLEAARVVEMDWSAKYGVQMLPEQFQAITSSFFIDLGRSGLINQLPIGEQEKPF